VQTYSIPNNDLLSNHASFDTRKYVLRVRDLPQESKPREKLIKGGPNDLSNDELIAIVLTTGTKKEGVLEMAARVLKAYGDKSLLVQTSVSSLAADLGIPLTKAAQLVACFELGRRFHGKAKIGPAIIRSPKDVFNYLRDMQHLPKEHLRGLYLNAYQRVIHDEVISIGTLDASLIHPREVFKPAIEYGAAAVILAHNHPSGSVKPSKADLDITNQLVAASQIIGISLLDHVIIARNRFASIEVEYS
jgi:DNA repair protein RadC